MHQASNSLLTAPSGLQLMQGTFEEFSIEDILQVIGLSRQLLLLSVTHQQKPLCQLILKSGQVLDALTASGDRGLNALVWLLRAASQQRSLAFVVLQINGTPSPLSPIGTLNDLYARARATIQQSPLSAPAPVQTSRATPPINPATTHPTASPPPPSTSRPSLTRSSPRKPPPLEGGGERGVANRTKGRERSNEVAGKEKKC